MVRTLVHIRNQSCSLSFPTHGCSTADHSKNFQFLDDVSQETLQIAAASAIRFRFDGGQLVGSAEPWHLFLAFSQICLWSKLSCFSIICVFDFRIVWSCNYFHLTICIHIKF